MGGWLTSTPNGARVGIEHPCRIELGRALARDTYDGLSFGDATTVAYMRRTGVPCCYSFDDDFDAVGGIVRLGTAVDPFRPS